MRTLHHDESGSAIIYALLIMVVVSIIGFAATNMSTTELQTANNDQLYKIAFHHADAGLYSVPKLVSRIIDEGEGIAVGTGTDSPGLAYLSSNTDPSTDFFRQLMGYDNYDGGTFDISLEPAGIPAQVDIQRNQSKDGGKKGSSLEFAMGYYGAGAGTGGGGSVSRFYLMESEGEGPRNSKAYLGAEYEKVINTPGGL